MRAALMNDFHNMVLETNDFTIGYLVGKQLTKNWLMCERDLNNMNEYLCKPRA